MQTILPGNSLISLILFTWLTTSLCAPPKSLASRPHVENQIDFVNEFQRISESMAATLGHRASAPLLLDQMPRQHRRLLWQLRQTTKFRHVQKQIVDVVVVAPSVAGWLDRRTRLRNQFPRNMQLAPHNQSALLRFAIGTKDLAPEQVNMTKLEQDTFSDLLFFDCQDADDALNWQPNWNLDAGQSSTTCKVLRTVQWAVQHYDFAYLFRLGDDSYFRIDKFLDMLAQDQLPKGKAVIGQILKTTIIGMHQEYPQGMGYGLTYAVCDFINTAAPHLLDTAPEDGVVARWLFAIGTKFVHSTAWRAINDGEPCDEEMVLGHKLPIDLWPNITETGLVEC